VNIEQTGLEGAFQELDMIRHPFAARGRPLRHNANRLPYRLLLIISHLTYSQTAHLYSSPPTVASSGNDISILIMHRTSTNDIQVKASTFEICNGDTTTKDVSAFAHSDASTSYAQSTLRNQTNNESTTLEVRTLHGGCLVCAHLAFAVVSSSSCQSPMSDRSL